MNNREPNEELSCKGQENGGASTGSERPLKKARFAWQVKGKYHLKNEINDITNSTSTASKSDTPGSSNESSPDMGAEQNLEILGDYLLKQDFNSLDSVIADSDKSLLKPSTSISTEQLQYPRYISSQDNNVPSMSRNNDSCSGDRSQPTTAVVPNSSAEDQCIILWQARQMAKSFVDNTINRVLDSWIQVPIPAEEDNSRVLALDVAEFINNLPEDNSIENEGILMAISAHGLQSTSTSSDNVSNEEVVDTVGIYDISSPTRSLSPLPSDSENQESVKNANEKYDDSIPDLDIKWSRDNNQRTDMSQFSLFPESSISYQCYNENQNSSIECGENAGDSHYDFLDTAVLFAIQTKGLTTFGTDYG